MGIQPTSGQVQQIMSSLAGPVQQKPGGTTTQVCTLIISNHFTFNVDLNN